MMYQSLFHRTDFEGQWFQILMIFEFPSARKFAYVRRSFGNGGSLHDDPKKRLRRRLPQQKIRNFLFLSPRTPSCPLFCPSGNQALFFFQSFPFKLEGLDDCLFRAIEKFGDKACPPSPMKVGIIYLAEK